MIVFLLSSLILLYGINEYQQKRKGNGFLVFVFFLTNGFHLINDNWYGSLPISKSTDFALLYLFFAFFRHALDKNFFRTSFQNYKWVLFFFTYITIEFFITILFGIEQIGYALKVYRNYIPLLSFFLLQELSFVELKQILLKISKIVFFTVLLHISQVATGIQVLQNSTIETLTVAETGIARFRNIPYFCYFLLIYFTINFKIKNKASILCLLTCLVSLLISQHRGPMIGYVSVTILFLILKKNWNKFIQFAGAALIVFFIAGDFLASRFTSESTGSDIQTVLAMNSSVSYTQYDRDDMGNFTFRVLLLEERIEHLVESGTIFTGVGLRHDDSPNTKRDFRFVLGSRKPTQSGLWEPSQLISGDLAWLTPLMSFGLIGIYFLLKITFANISFLFKRRNKSRLAMAAFLFNIFLLFISFKNDHLFGMMQIVFLFIIIEYHRKAESNSYYNENIDFNLFKRI